MARVAIVTGGTRGIGEAISIALRDMGIKVAANYAGNEERAREFSERGVAIQGHEKSRPQIAVRSCQHVMVTRMMGQDFASGVADNKHILGPAPTDAIGVNTRLQRKHHVFL